MHQTKKIKKSKTKNKKKGRKKELELFNRYDFIYSSVFPFKNDFVSFGF
jgi:hypothetical protein